MKALVFVETVKGNVREVSLEAIGFARILAEEVVGVAVGKDLDIKGLDRLYLYEDERLSIPISKPIVEIISEVQGRENAKYIILPSTSFGKELGGRLSAKLSAPILDDIMGYEDGMFIKGFYSNKVFARIKIDGNPVVLSVRSRAFKPYEGNVEGEKIKLDITLEDGYFSSKPVELKERKRGNRCYGGGHRGFGWKGYGKSGELS